MTAGRLFGADEAPPLCPIEGGARVWTIYGLGVVAGAVPDAARPRYVVRLDARATRAGYRGTVIPREHVRRWSEHDDPAAAGATR